MEIKAKICKVMPSVEGEGRNGHYKFTPFIIEWDEIENGQVVYSIREGGFQREDCQGLLTWLLWLEPANAC
jgi:hypothetical protein